MINKLYIILFLSICSLTVLGQKNYWQQKVDFNITVKLNDKEHMLNAFIDINYRNNSADTLHFIYFHLWPNAYKNNETALAKQFLNVNNTKFQFAKLSERGYIDSLHFKVDNKTAKVEQTNHIDVVKVLLPKPLLSGENTQITTPFRVKIPGDFSRLGHDGQSYQISQWYPKPAVYDQYGWHQMPYLDQGEFFSEFGKFTVTIQLPKNYRVASTGVLKSKAEKVWVDSIANLTPDSTMHDYVPSSKEYKSITYEQDSIHDFAWFANKNYQITKSKVKLPSGKTVETYGFYLPESYWNWKKSAHYIDSAVYYYSCWVGEYPYASASAVQGALSAGGGMEYPMVTVISTGNSDFELDQVITHEVGHNWFYGILASNERIYPWIDEGFNTFIESRYIEKRYPETTIASMIGVDFISDMFSLHQMPYGRLNYYASIILGSMGKQVPINTPSAQMNSLNYGLNSYMRTGQLLRYLMDYLGEEMMDKCMNAYFEKYKFKHVYPQDMIAVFEEVSGEDLDWFFIDLFNTNKQIDAKLVSAKSKEVKVKNIGSAKIPLGITNSVDKKSTIKWTEPKLNKAAIPTPNEWKSASIFSNYNAPDINPENNKEQKFSVNFLTGLPEQGINKLYWLPYIGYNTVDKFILGAAVHNFSLIPETFEYYLAPAFSFGDKKLIGSSILKYDWLIPESRVSKLRAQLVFEQFSIYQKINPKFSIHFLNNKPFSSSNWIEIDYNKVSIKPEFDYYYTNNQYGRIQYFHQNLKGITQEKIRIALTVGSDGNDPFSTIDFKYFKQIKLNSSNDLDFSLFAGTYLQKPSLSSYLYNLQGSSDYGMNHYLIDRANNGNLNNLGSYQVINDQAEFRSFNALAQDYISSLTVTYHKHGIPFKPYGSAALIDNEFYYEAGLTLDFNVVGIYFPIVNNGDFNELPKDFNQWLRSISFKINLGRGNLLNQIETLLD